MKSQRFSSSTSSLPSNQTSQAWSLASGSVIWSLCGLLNTTQHFIFLYECIFTQSLLEISFVSCSHKKYRYTDRHLALIQHHNVRDFKKKKTKKKKLPRCFGACVSLLVILYHNVHSASDSCYFTSSFFLVLAAMTYLVPSNCEFPQQPRKDRVLQPSQLF